MKAAIDRAEWSRALALVGAAVPSRTPKEILFNVRLTAEDGDSARLFATNLDRDAEATFPASVFEPGTVLLPADRLKTILASATASDLELSSDESSVLIQAGKSRFRMPAANPDLYPDPSPWNVGGPIEVDAVDLAVAIRRVEFSTDVDSTRYALGGAVFTSGPGLTLVSTDSVRLSMATLATPSDLSGLTDLTHVVPADALKAIVKALPDSGPVSLAFGKTSFVLDAPPARVSGRLIEGRFPRYRDVVDDAAAVRFAFETSAGGLAAAISQAAVAASNESRWCDFTFGDAALRIDCRSADLGDAHAEVEIDYSGPSFTIGLNPFRLIQALKAIGPVPVKFEVLGERRPIVLRADGYDHFLQPVTKG